MFILKTELNENKKIKTELRKIYGLNFFLIQKICQDLGLNHLSLLKNLQSKHLGLINNWVTKNNILLNEDLKKLSTDSKKNLIFIKCYKGFRHEEGLPVRGQRTRTNSKTQKRLNGVFSKKKVIKKKVIKKKVIKKKVIKKKVIKKK